MQVVKSVFACIPIPRLPRTLVIILLPIGLAAGAMLVGLLIAITQDAIRERFPSAPEREPAVPAAHTQGDSARMRCFVEVPYISKGIDGRFRDYMVEYNVTQADLDAIQPRGKPILPLESYVRKCQSQSIRAGQSVILVWDLLASGRPRPLGVEDGSTLGNLTNRPRILFVEYERASEQLLIHLDSTECFSDQFVFPMTTCVCPVTYDQIKYFWDSTMHRGLLLAKCDVKSLRRLDDLTSSLQVFEHTLSVESVYLLWFNERRTSTECELIGSWNVAEQERPTVDQEQRSLRQEPGIDKDEQDWLRVSLEIESQAPSDIIRGMSQYLRDHPDGLHASEAQIAVNTVLDLFWCERVRELLLIITEYPELSDQARELAGKYRRMGDGQSMVDATQQSLEYTKKVTAATQELLSVVGWAYIAEWPSGVSKDTPREDLYPVLRRHRNKEEYERWEKALLSEILR